MSDIFTLPLACYAFSFVVKVKLQGKKKMEPLFSSLPLKWFRETMVNLMTMKIVVPMAVNAGLTLK